MNIYLSEIMLNQLENCVFTQWQLEIGRLLQDPYIRTFCTSFYPYLNHQTSNVFDDDVFPCLF
jgi:hypothetical protein